jgi:hypothetical protein
VTRVRLAHYLGRLPHEIDSAPARDIADVLAVLHADEKINRRAK